jgi:hypothetical protein
MHHYVAREIIRQRTGEMRAQARREAAGRQALEARRGQEARSEQEARRPREADRDQGAGAEVVPTLTTASRH